MRKRNMTDAEFRRIKVITSAQEAKANSLLGFGVGKRKLSKFGTYHLIGPYRLWIIERDGSVSFSGRRGKSP